MRLAASPTPKALPPEGAGNDVAVPDAALHGQSDFDNWMRTADMRRALPGMIMFIARKSRAVVWRRMPGRAACQASRSTRLIMRPRKMMGGGSGLPRG